MNQNLSSKDLLLKEGAIVDAALIAALPSTKSREGKRAPDLHQSKTGKQWHFGMRTHI